MGVLPECRMRGFCPITSSAAIAGDLYEGLVDVLDPGVQVGDDDAFRALLDRQRQCAQAILRRAHGADIGMCADHAPRLSVGVPGNDAALVEYPFPAAIPASDPVLAAVGVRVAAKMPVDLGPDGGPVVGMNALGPLAKIVAEFDLAEAEHGLETGRVERLAGGDVPVPDAMAGAVERQDPPFVGGPHFLFRLARRGDVAGDAEHADQAFVAVAHGGLDGGQQLAAVVTGELDPFLVRARAAGDDRRPIMIAEECRLLGVDQIPVGATDHLIPGLADEPREGRVAVEIDAVGILQPDEVGNGFHQGAQRPFARRRPAVVTRQQQQQQGRGDGDEQPALERSRPDDGGHGRKQPADRDVRHADPERGEDGVQGDDAQYLASVAGARGGAWRDHGRGGSTAVVGDWGKHIQWLLSVSSWISCARADGSRSPAAWQRLRPSALAR